jgi:hypothetical protein
MRNWSRRERGLGAALVLAVAAAIAVPAWAGDGDPASVEPATVASGEGGAVIAAVKPDGLADCLRRHGANLPVRRPEGDEQLLVPKPRLDDDGGFRRTFRRAAEACGLPEPPRGHDPFPLTDEQIQTMRDKLTAFVGCMRDHGQELGDPEIDRNRIKILLPSPKDAFSEEFLDAQRACGGPPVGP